MFYNLGTPQTLTEAFMLEKDERNWAVALHLSVLAGWLVPMAGLVAPIAIWMVKKDESPLVAEEGRKVINMLLTLLIAGLVAGVLCLILIGFVLLAVLAAYSIIMPIFAAVKTANGERFEYPFCMKFLKSPA